MAMPMCASRSAGASFTPSPVIATTAPFSFHARTMFSFCSGVTRAYTFSSGSSSGLRMPSSRAMA
jgi:hypothetical protein